MGLTLWAWTQCTKMGSDGTEVMSQLTLFGFVPVLFLALQGGRCSSPKITWYRVGRESAWGQILGTAFPWLVSTPSPWAPCTRGLHWVSRLRITGGILAARVASHGWEAGGITWAGQRFLINLWNVICSYYIFTKAGCLAEFIGQSHFHFFKS